MTYLSKVQKRNLFGIVLFLLMFTALLAATTRHVTLVWSVLFAALLYHSFLPIATTLENKLRLTRDASSVLFLGVFFSSILFLGSYGIPLLIQKVTDFKNSFVYYRENLFLKLNQLENHELLKPFANFNFLEEFNPGDYVLTFLGGLTENVYSIVLTLILSPIITFFLLKDGNGFKSYLLSFVPNNMFELISEVQAEINFKMGAFIRARLLEAVFVGVFIFFGLYFLGRPHALLLAIFAGVTNLLPYIGPIIGAIPALALALMSNETFWAPSSVALLFAVAQFIDGFILMPALVSRIVNLHPLMAIVSVMIGGKVLGLLGIVVAIPLCVIAQIIFSNLRQIQSLS